MFVFGWSNLLFCFCYAGYEATILGQGTVDRAYSIVLKTSELSEIYPMEQIHWCEYYLRQSEAFLTE